MLDGSAERRALLELRPNPRSQVDFVVSLERRLPDALTTLGAGSLQLRYVPDRELLRADSLAAYLQAAATLDWDCAEALGAAVFDDLNNQLVPRWLHCGISGPDGRIDFLDRQPDWRNDALLATLALR